MKVALARIAPVAQGLVYVGAGLWPIVHIRSFERVTGRKKETWLVKTVGSLLVVIGTTLLVRRRAAPSLRMLAIGSAAALTAIDIAYVARGRISRVYLADAALHVALAAMWFAEPVSTRR
jgi:hypothetical protein